MEMVIEEMGIKKRSRNTTQMDPRYNKQDAYTIQNNVCSTIKFLEGKAVVKSLAS